MASTLFVLALALGVRADVDGRRLTASCEDDPSWSTAKPSQTCSWVASKSTGRRCNRAESVDGVKASEACPVTCGTCPVCDASGSCCDDADWYAKKSSQGCAWIASAGSTKQKNKRCKKKGLDDVTGREACPVTCGTCPACVGECCNDASWYVGKPSQGCDWVAAKPNKRCKKSNSDETPASKACPVACDTCATFPVPSTTAEKTECLGGKGDFEGLTEDFCGTCCPACTAAVVGTSSFTSHFELYYGAWKPNDAFTGCACLDLDGNGYNFDAEGYIELTSSSDCVRITGDHNSVYAFGGDDAMYSNGVGNALIAGSGDDQLVMDGSDGQIWGGSGEGDVCTDLSGSNTFSPFSCDGNCYGSGGDAWPLDCATGNPPLPQIIECFRDDTIADGDHCKMCCPACTAADTSSFTSYFHRAPPYGFYWGPKPEITGCVCLDLDADDYGYYGKGAIDLTSSSDCVRIRGDRNDVWGEDGDDAMFAEGDDNFLYGQYGDDHIAMDGSDGIIWGGDGYYDVCTDLSGLNTFEYSCDGNCFDAEGDEVDCARDSED